MLSLFYGTSRSALKATCLRAVLDGMAASPRQKILLLVPEQTKLQMEEDLLDQGGRKALLTTEVLSFKRLAWRLLGEVGHQGQAAIDATGRTLLLYRVLQEKRADLKTLGPFADKPGFVTDVATVLGDLKRHRLEVEELDRAAQLVSDPLLHAKIHDLSCIMAAYQEQMSQSGLEDGDDDLTRLGDLLRSMSSQSQMDPWPLSRLAWLRKAAVWVTGFGELRDFTPQEDVILSQLVRLTRSVSITVAADGMGAPDQDTGGMDAFVPGRRALWRLADRLPLHQLQVVDPPKTALTQQLQTLLRHGQLLPDGGKGDDGQPFDGGLQLIQASSLDDEVTWVAGTIRQLVQLEGYRYRDIALAVTSLPDYGPRLRSVFRSFQIPLFLSGQRSLSGTPLMRYVIGLLDIGLRGWNRSDLMACLRSGLSPLNSDALDQLENLWLARGLFRETLLFEDGYYQEAVRLTSLDQLEADPPQAGSDPTLLRWRDQALRPIQAFLTGWADRGNCSGQVEALRTFLEEVGVADRLQDQAAELIAAGDADAATTLIQSWNALQHVLDQMLQLFGDQILSLQGFRDLLHTSMDQVAPSAIPSALDQVHVGALQQAMFREPKILILVGASAAWLPPPLPQEGLLKDQDRSRLSEISGHHLPSRARDQVFADALVLESLLTRPMDRLVMTAPDPQASVLFDRLAEAFPTALTVLGANPALGDPRLNAREPLGRWLLQDEDKPPLAWLEELLSDAGWVRPDLVAPDIQVSHAHMKAFYQPPVTLSVSQLETYADCPFKQFTERLLSLQPRPEWQPQPMETGRVLHGMLEEALRFLSRSFDPFSDRPAGFWGAWLDRDLTDLIGQAFEKTLEASQMKRLQEAGLNASVGRWVRKTIESTLRTIMRQLQSDPYQPAHFEWHFSGSQGTALPLETPAKQTVWLQGLIDRVDRQEEPQMLFRVVDYKSSDRQVNVDALYHGLALQLPVYLAAYAQVHPGARPGDAAWLSVNRPQIWYPDGNPPQADRLLADLMRKQKPVSLNLEAEDLERLCRHAVHTAGVYAGRLLTGSFAPLPSRLPGRPVPCTFCSYAAICQFDQQKGPWRWLALLQKEAGQTAQARLLKALAETYRTGDVPCG